MNANPFRDLFDFAIAVRDESLARHSYTVKGDVSPWPHFSRYAPRRMTQLDQTLETALRAAPNAGFSVDEVSRRLRAVEGPLRRLIAWERDAAAGVEEPLNPDWAPEHFPDGYRTSDISTYLIYYGAALAQALPALHEVMLFADSRQPEAPKVEEGGHAGAQTRMDHDGGGNKPTTKTLTVDLAKKRLTLDGMPHDVGSENALRWVRVLADHPGEWISSTQLQQYDRELLNTRTDRWRKHLPPQILDLIESDCGKGSRLRLA